MFHLLRYYIQSEEAATAVEYGLFIVGIGLAIIAVLFSLGDQLADGFAALGDAVIEERGQ